MVQAFKLGYCGQRDMESVLSVLTHCVRSEIFAHSLRDAGRARRTQRYANYKQEKRTQPRKGRRTAIVAGLRSPFVKSSTVFSKHTSLDLASRVVGELLARTNLSPSEIDQVVYGQVVPNVAAPNIAREVVLATGMPHAVDAYSVSRACATSTQAIVNGALAIENGAADVVIAGGVESLSKPPITFSDGFVQVLMKANSARDTISKAKAFADLKLKDLAPVPPAIAEFSTGETMGQSAEKMAKLNGCTRAEQDEIALLSHQRAAKAWENGVYEQEVMAVETGDRATSLSRRIPWFALTRPQRSSASYDRYSIGNLVLSLPETAHL